MCPPINCPSGNSVKLWTNKVHCSGIEMRLLDCSGNWIAGNYCNNSYKAASVKCPGKTCIIYYSKHLGNHFETHTQYSETCLIY